MSLHEAWFLLGVLTFVRIRVTEKSKISRIFPPYRIELYSNSEILEYTHNLPYLIESTESINLLANIFISCFYFSGKCLAEYKKTEDGK